MTAFLLAVPVILIVFMTAMTVYVIKNIGNKKEREEPEKIEKQKWEHIKDFSNINAKDNNKINAFGSGFEDDVRTVGVEFSDNMKEEHKENMSYVQTQEDNLKRTIENDFVNDYMTMSIDSQGKLYTPEEQEPDETVDMFGSEATEIMAQNMEVTLRYKDGNYNKMMKMETSRITVGRGVDNDLVFKSECYASKKHAIFEIRNGKLYLTDLNSKNGTYIDGSKERIDGEVLLEKSCDVIFGDVSVNVSIVYR